MSTTSRDDRRYLDELAVHLQLWSVPGERIGEILAEAEAHAAESGESLRGAFGDPKEYALQWAAAQPPRRRNWLRIAGYLLWGASAAVLTFGATGLAMGQDGLDWLLIVLGTLSCLGSAAFTPLDRIRDPRTGTHRGWSRTTTVLLALGMCVIIAGAGLVGAMLR